MYLCAVCGKCSKSKEPRKTWATYRTVPAEPRFNQSLARWEYGRTRKEIEREFPVCSDCYGNLANGVPLDDLVAAHDHQTTVVLRSGNGVRERVEVEETVQPDRYNKPVRFAEPVARSPYTGQPVPLADPKIGKRFLETYRCDVCGGPVGYGQVTAEAVLCPKCVRK